MERKLVCISCPVGCNLTVRLKEDGTVQSVEGNRCKRGEIYGTKEVTAPARTVTSTVLLESAELPVLPVRTRTDIPKEKMDACMEELRRARITAPVRAGDVVVADIAGTGVDLIATRTVAARP